MPPPLISRTAGPIYKIQTVFDKPWEFIKENSMSLISGLFMTSQAAQYQSAWRFMFGLSRTTRGGSRGAAGADSPSPTEDGAPAPNAQGRQFSPPLDSPNISARGLFLHRMCYNSPFPPAKAPRSDAKRHPFAYDSSLLGRYGAPLATRSARLAQK